MDKFARLIEEARGLNGMIAEISCKCRLLIPKVENQECDEGILEKVEQMQTDLDKYSKRLNEIFVEFGTYGIVPKME